MYPVSVLAALLFVVIPSRVEGLTLYYFAASPGCRSVDLLLHTLGVAVEYNTVDITQGHQFQPEYLKVNPLNTIPAIDDNDFVLWESHAIMTYLVSKYASNDTLYPSDLQKRAIVDQRLHYSNDVFFAAKQFTMALYKGNKELLPFLLEEVKKQQSNVEKLLKSGRFMAGDSLTVVDFSYINLMDIIQVYSPAEGEFPLTEEWIKRCRSAIKDFDKISKPGADMFKEGIKKVMSS